MSPLAAYALFTASGFAGLIYESIWTQYLKLYLGHAAYAQSLVLIVFMGGMAIGAALCARMSERLTRPLITYAMVEAAVGVLALGFHEIYGLTADWSYGTLLPMVSDEWAVTAARFAMAAALILPQSILLGATFPLMSAGLARSNRSRTGESLAMLYFTNSLGAAAGVLTSGFVLVAWVGLPGTLRIAGMLNLALATVVWFMARRVYVRPITADAVTAPGNRLLGLVALMTGLASFIYEICWIRMLSLVLGASTHSFELMLSAFIGGLALGGLCVRRLVDRVTDPGQLLGWVQIAMGTLALGTLLVYDRSFLLMEYLMGGLARTDAGYVLFSLAGAFIAVLVMLPATLCAGMTLPLITGTLMREGAGERAIGHVYALNTLGAILGVLAAVHVGMPHLGLKNTLISGAWIDVTLGLMLIARSGRRGPAIVASIFALLLFVPALLLLHLDVNKMTAGVFRHGELASSRDAKVVYQRDGKTATVHLVRYPEALSIRTNGKSDGSVTIDGTRRGSDETTMILTAAIPLALKPDIRRAAVIGIGTGLTMHTLLQSLTVERVDTVEIEAAMVEAARGFAPHNSAAFADPRGAITIDDAKAYFSAGRRTYDLIISEPSNPWVSGVSGLFTREFYQRIRPHLNNGGLLVQWFQLYEIDAALLASVMKALGSEFPHYAVFAPSDHDLLIIASDHPVPVSASARVFDDPSMAAELRSIQMVTPGDFDARYLGSRIVLEPLFESYAIPANSDFRPVLDLRAARDRFTERSATDIVGLLGTAVPALEMLVPSFVRRPSNPWLAGTHERSENTRLARYARDFLLGEEVQPSDAVSAQLQKDLEILRFRLMECRAPRDHDVWLHSMLRVSALINPNLDISDLRVLWRRLGAGCSASLLDFQRDWLALFRAVAERDAKGMSALGARLLETQTGIFAEAREYLLAAAMTGAIVGNDRANALVLWQAQQGALGAKASQPLFRLLRCQGNPDCASDFAGYERH